MAIYVELDSVPRALQDLNDGIRDDITDIIQEEVRNGLALARQLAIEQGKVGVRDPHYIDSFRYEESRTGASLVNDAPYADAIEYGTKPYYLSKEGVENIAEWARGKLGLSDRAAKDMAYAVKAKIASQGISPTYIMADTLEQIEWNIRRRLRQYAFDHRAGRTPALIRFRSRWGTSQRRRSVSV